MTTIDPGAGYRLLKDGETLQEGDECHVSTGWQPAYIGEIVKVHSSCTYRRKIEPKQGEWIPINGQYSSIQFPCWVADSKGVVFAENATGMGWATHWWPLKCPAPPPAEDPSQKAFEEWAKSLTCLPDYGTARAAFKAGAQWQKQQK